MTGSGIQSKESIGFFGTIIFMNLREGIERSLYTSIADNGGVGSIGDTVLFNSFALILFKFLSDH